MLFATAVSDLPIADALAEPRFRALFVRLAREVLAIAPVPVESFDGFDPDDLDASIDRLVEFNRRSAKTHSGIYRDLAVRKRKAETSILEDIDSPLVRRTLELIHQIEDGGRVCEVANLDLLAAYARLEQHGRRLNAVITVLRPAARSVDGPLHGAPVAVKDNIDVRGVVTTNASTVGVPPPAREDAPAVARLRAAGAELLCKANLLEYAAGSVNPAYGMTFNPRDESRTSGGSSSGSAALVAAGVCDLALGTDTGGSIRIPAAYCGIVGLKPTYGLVPAEGVFPLSRTCDHVGTLTRTVAQTATLLGVLAGRDYALRPVAGLRVGVLRRQLDDPDVTPAVRALVAEGVERLRAAGLEVRDVDLPELDLVDDALGAIILREAWEVHRELFEREADGYGPGTRALLELGSQVDDERYRAGLVDREHFAACFARLFEQVDVLAGPTVAYAAPARGPAGRDSGGRSRGPLHRPVQPRGQPGSVAAVRPRRRRPARRAPARRGGRQRGTAPVGRPSLRGGTRVRAQDCNWMQLEEYLRRRRPDRAPARIGRAARVPVACGRPHPVRARLGRGCGTARRARAAFAAVRDHAVLRRLSR